MTSECQKGVSASADHTHMAKPLINIYYILTMIIYLHNNNYDYGSDISKNN